MGCPSTIAHLDRIVVFRRWGLTDKADVRLSRHTGDAHAPGSCATTHNAPPTALIETLTTRPFAGANRTRRALRNWVAMSSALQRREPAWDTRGRSMSRSQLLRGGESDGRRPDLETYFGEGSGGELGRPWSMRKERANPMWALGSRKVLVPKIAASTPKLRVRLKPTPPDGYQLPCEIRPAPLSSTPPSLYSRPVRKFSPWKPCEYS